MSDTARTTASGSTSDRTSTTAPPTSRTVTGGAVRWIVGACVMWALVSAGIVARTAANVEYALAAHEGRALVAREGRALAAPEGRATSARADSVAPSTAARSRRVIASAPLPEAHAALSRFLGRPARSLDAQDRALVHAAWWHRAVSLPIKDRDEWEIIGAVALEASPWRPLGLPLALVAVAALLAIGLARRAVSRAAGDRAVSPALALAPPLSVLATCSLGLVLLVRGSVERAQALLPPATAVARFDALALPLPSAPLASLALALTLAAATAVIAAAAWAVSARRRPADRRETLTAWGFLAPSALHLLVFTAGPLAFTLYVSMHDWDLLRVDRPFVGLGNYAELARDPLFWRALANTALYALYVPVSMALALGAALILDQPLKGMKALRAVVFLPTVVSYVAIAVVWQWMFNVDFGLLNFLMRAVQLPAVDWLGNPKTALVAVMIVSAWVQLGYQMVIYLAGLQGIPAHLHEAATLDGAAAWARFRHITFPLLRPVTVYLFVTGIIWSFQVFTLVYVMTEGGPVHATDVLVYRIYQNAWEFRRMGYASAMSWVLFAILLGLTLLQWRALNRKVDDAA